MPLCTKGPRLQMHYILLITLIFRCATICLGGYSGEAALEDGLLQRGKCASRDCRASENHKEANTNNSLDFLEMDGFSEASYSEALQNNTLLPLDDLTVITFGTFDILHNGHLNLLRRAKELGQKLVVGICTDAATQRKKGRLPVYSEDQRREIVGAIRYVDHVFVASKSKREHILEWNANVLVMGSDHGGQYDWLRDTCEVIYLPRTSGISTTEILKQVVAQSTQR